MLELNQVTKSFGNTQAIRPLNLSLARGETVALIGPSGSGKSTLLRVMVGLVHPDRGRVSVDGQNLDGANIQHLRQRMGYVIQEGGLFPHLTARQNLSLQAQHVGWHAERIEARIAELIELTRLPADILERYPLQLSGGQRQRVSLARALMLDPDILLMDEPLGALDPMIRAELQLDLQKIFRSLGKTVVLVTHDLAEASFFTTRLILLHEGRIVQEGSFSELCHEPATPFVAAFVNAQRALHPGDPEVRG